MPCWLLIIWAFFVSPVIITQTCNWSERLKKKDGLGNRIVYHAVEALIFLEFMLLIITLGLMGKCGESSGRDHWMWR